MKKKPFLTGSRFWREKPPAPPAGQGLETILCSVVNLPLPYWRPRFFFTGAPDIDLYGVTDRKFPATPQQNKTHPVFTLAPLPDGIGCKVCPCSSKRPFKPKQCRCIRKGCVMRHTGFRTDRASHLIESVTFNMPRSLAARLKFRGETPPDCIFTKSFEQPGKRT